jgi:hypothetical protein
MKTTVASFLFADVKGYSNLEERHIKCFYEDILPELKVRIDNYREALQDIQRLRYPCGTANPLFNSVMPILYVPD